MKNLIVSMLGCIITTMIAVVVTLNTVSFAATGTVNTDTARVRSKASTDSTVVQLLSINDTVEVLEESGEWYKIKVDGKTGYVSKDLLKVDGKVEDNTTAANTKEEKTEETSEGTTENATESTTENATEEAVEKSEEKTNTEQTENKIEESYTGSITADLPIKILPSINSSDITKIEKNTEIKVVEVINDWCHIETSTVSGWVRMAAAQAAMSKASSDIKQDETPAKDEVTQNKKGYVISETVNVRETPTTASGAVDSLIKGTEVTIIGEENGWYKVQVNGQTGYISTKYISDKKPEVTSRASETARKVAEDKAKAEAEAKAKAEQQNASAAKAAVAAAPKSSGSSKGNDVVNFAKQYLGSRYVSGGSSPSGFDCSGFTSYVYRNFGVSLSRSSKAQASNGTSSKSNLQAGDVLIFQNRSKTSVGHVGIYMGGNRFIHAATSKTGVITSSLSEGYYSQRFVDARRVLP